MTSFSDLSLRSEIQAAIAAQGYETPTPIQAQAIPPALLGQDILGIAQTGTGKTAAFTLPILQRLSDNPARPGSARALILTPTRELAIQIGDSIRDYGAGLALRHAVIFGGVGQSPQVDALRRGLDILVATPGRLLDLMNQGHVHLDRLEVFVLDEADRMLDMGFIHDVRKVIAKLPKQRQTLFFSATMPKEITDLAARLLNDPVRVEVTPVATTAEKVDQRVIFVPAADKRHLLVDMLGKDASMDRVIVFTRTKHGANKVTEHLAKANISAAAIHGNKSQSARQTALEGFRAGTVRVLVATDIAARGIDVDGVSHVVNYELPNIPESYVHRIGRTARAGASGIAIAFCDHGEERIYLRDIEKLTRKPLTVIGEAPARRPAPEAPKAQPPAHRQAAPKPQPHAKRPPSAKHDEPRHPRGDHPRQERAPRDGQGRAAATPRDAARSGAPRRGPSAFGDLVSAINNGAPAGRPSGRKPDRRR
ncbi:MAG TPA: DEAD/DEAH box helicase [Azospirillum sp.]|nr:DEAD/DEAH box helicase [Azospirillum sp.]